MKQKIAIIGALSSLGQSMLQGFAEHCFSSSDILAIDTSLGQNKEVPYGSQMIPLYPIEDFPFQKVGVSFLTTPTLISEYKEELLGYDQYVVDCMGTYSQGPCVIANFNGELLEENRLIVNPTGMTITLAQILRPIHQRFKISHLEGTIILSAGEFGNDAVQALFNQTRSLYTREDVSEGPFQKVQAFNILPEISPYLVRTTIDQIKSLFHFPLNLATCLSPLFQGECYSLSVSTKEGASLKQIEYLYKNHSCCQIYQELLPQLTVTPQDIACSDLIYLTHLKNIPYLKNTFQTWVICDSIRTGSVLNAIRIAQKILKLRK